MFNYDDLQVTLTVTPEISPTNFYTKEDTDRLFVKDVGDASAVYGRSNGKWVQIDENYNSLFAGFLSIYSFEDFVLNEGYKNLTEIPFVASANNIQINLTNENDGDTLWICSADNIESIRTKQRLPVEFTREGEAQFDETTYQVYSIKALEAGDYDLTVTLQ